MAFLRLRRAKKAAAAEEEAVVLAEEEAVVVVIMVESFRGEWLVWDLPFYLIRESSIDGKLEDALSALETLVSQMHLAHTIPQYTLQVLRYCGV